MNWDKHQILLHVGYPKSGSTYLQRELFNSESPIWYPIDRDAALKHFAEPDGLDFRPQAARDHLAETVDWTKTSERVLVMSQEGLMNIAGSYGIKTKEIADRLFDAFGDAAKVLIVVREQRAQILSHFVQYRKWGGRLNLRQFLKQDSIPDRSAPVFRFSLFEYDRTVRHYMDRFGKRNVLVLALEQLAANSQVFFVSIYDLVGIESSRRIFPDPTARHNVTSLSPVELMIRARTRNFAQPRSWRPDSHHRPATLRAMLRIERVASALVPKSAQQRIVESWKREIAVACDSRYAASNRRLAVVTGLPLGRLGYVVAE